jgi:ABC-type lipoprotein release transport system permease subunit
VKVVGVFRSQTQSDAELLVSMDTINMLVGDGSISFIELVLKKDLNSPKVIDEIARLLPKDVKLVEVQQIKGLARQVGLEALSFLSAWSWVVYAAIVATSYAIASRFVVESSYELAMLRALGAKRSTALAIVLGLHSCTDARELRAGDSRGHGRCSSDLDDA